MAKPIGIISTATPTCRANWKRICVGRDPAWASTITGTPVETIEEFAKLIGERKRAYFRLGYGFSRSRNGAANMHAASCIAAVTGAWQLEGGGAFHGNADIYKLDKTLIEGLDRFDRSVRMLDQSRIGAILTGERDALQGGGPVTALIIQNTNPMSVAPDQTQVKRGFARDDLFVCVHEQFMTETAKMADVVLPATTFLEHDDVYRGGGHQYIILGPKLVEPPGECRNNHEVICGLAKRVGAEHPGFALSPRELIDQMLRVSKRGTLAELEANRWIDCQPPFEKAHYLDGFAWPDGKFRFKPDWPNCAVPQSLSKRAGGRHAGPAGSLDVDRAGGRGSSVPARHLAGARFPELNFQRNADVTGAGKAAGGDDPSRRRQGARDRRRRLCGAGQQARRGAAARAPVSTACGAGF